MTWTKVTSTGMPLDIEQSCVIPSTGAYLCSGNVSYIANIGLPGNQLFQYVPSSPPGSATGTWSSSNGGGSGGDSWHPFAVNIRYDTNKMVANERQIMAGLWLAMLRVMFPPQKHLP